MKMSATTLACPAWDLDTVFARFKEYGYDGVDFRGLKGNNALFTMPEFTTDVDNSVKKAAKSGLEITGFSSSAILVSTGADRQKWAEEVKTYAGLCRKFGCKFIRVFGGSAKGYSRDQAVATALETLNQCCDAAGEDIMVGVETHDDFCHTDMLKQLFEQVKRPNAGVLWDIGNPFLEYGEPIETSYINIAKWIVYTHVKDAMPMVGGKLEYKLAGEGLVPLDKAIGMLKMGGYKGYLTVEWEKRWHPEIAEPEVALPAFAKFMKKQIAK